jgi:RsiW-degrading membrane proteinase PrsW (M82 family)
LAIVVNGLVLLTLGLPFDRSEAMMNPGTLHLLLISVFLAGPIEELIKYVVLRYSVYAAKEFNQVFDGIVYGVIIALTFSLVENIVYFQMIQSSASTLAFVLTVMYRSIFTTLLHVTATGITGYFVGRAKFNPGNHVQLVIQGLLYASLLHGLFNVLVSNVIPFGQVLSNILLFGSFVLLVRVWNRPDVRMTWKVRETVPRVSQAPLRP